MEADGEEEKSEGIKFEKERVGTGREKECKVRWCLPPAELRVRRKRRPEVVDDMYV